MVREVAGIDDVVFMRERRAHGAHGLACNPVSAERYGMYGAGADTAGEEA